MRVPSMEIEERLDEGTKEEIRRFRSNLVSGIGQSQRKSTGFAPL